MAVVGIDLGTQSVKVAAVGDDGRVLAAATRPYPVRSPHPGWAEADPAEWLAATVDAANEVVATSPEPAQAVGLSGQMHG
ncbi:MAG: FGGY family carbohydrate kinase, partial [Actinomycetota bacterium]